MRPIKSLLVGALVISSLMMAGVALAQTAMPTPTPSATTTPGAPATGRGQ